MVAVCLYLLLPKLIGTRDAFSLITKANLWWLIVALVFEIVALTGYALLTRFVFSLLNVFLSLWLTLRINLAGFAASRIFSIGGIGGFVFTYSALAKRGVSRSIAVVAIAAQQFFIYIDLWLIFAISLFYLSSQGEDSGGTSVVAIVFICLILGGLIYLIYLYFHPTQFRRRARQFVGGLNHLRKNKVDLESIDDWVDNVRAGIRPMVGRRGSMWRAAVFAFIYWGCDILCLFFVFQAFDYTVPLLALLVSYSIAYTVGTFAPTPGGLGAVEALLLATFAIFRVPSDVAVASVLVYRLINYWLPLPIGLLAYVTVRGGKDALAGDALAGDAEAPAPHPAGATGESGSGPEQTLARPAPAPVAGSAVCVEADGCGERQTGDSDSAVADEPAETSDRGTG